MTFRRLLPYISVFAMDSLLFPILFIGAWLLFAVHAVLLFILCLPKGRIWRSAACLLVLSIQILHCYNTVNVTSPYAYVIAGFIVLPVWIGYLVDRTLRKRKECQS